MRRPLTVLAIATLCLATSLATGCGLAADILLGSDAAGSHLVEPGVDDCHGAVDQCESFITAMCDRIDACGIRPFDECIDGLLTGGLPCETADGADDASQCNDALAVTRCEDLQRGVGPSVCDDVNFHFSDDGSVCR